MWVGADKARLWVREGRSRIGSLDGATTIACSHRSTLARNLHLSKCFSVILCVIGIGFDSRFVCVFSFVSVYLFVCVFVCVCLSVCV